MKIALVSTSLGYIQRGIERFTLELFEHIKGQVPITLFGNRLPKAQNHVSLPCMKFNRALSVFRGRKRDNYYYQQLTYALTFIPHVVKNDYDIVHYSEPAIGNFLFHARRAFKLKYKLIFTDALGLYPHLDPFFFERRDLIQTITTPQFDRLMKAGADPDRVSMLPYGVDTGRYSGKRDKAKLRAKYGIPEDKKVILTVAALNRRHKRIDYLIREISQLGDDYCFAVAGQPEEPDLIDLGRDLLGENFKPLYVSFDEVADIYHIADLFVFPCIIGEFGLALAEAMSAGVPLIADRYFEWMVQDSRCLTDLSRHGSLSKKIEEVMADYGQSEQIARECQERAITRFDWKNLVSQYVDMYHHVNRLSPAPRTWSKQSPIVAQKKEVVHS
jgi:glycosyltransferase involved in cell wall biosynthesis